MPKSIELPVLRRTSKYNPTPIRRRVNRVAVTPDAIVICASKSMTRDDDAIRHHTAIDLQSGKITCECEHFRYRLAKLNPTLACAATWCKHAKRAIEGCERRGEVSFVKDGSEIVGAVRTFDAPLQVGSSFDPEFDEYAEDLENTERQRAAEEGSDIPDPAIPQTWPFDDSTSLAPVAPSSPVVNPSVAELKALWMGEKTYEQVFGVPAPVGSIHARA